MSGQLEFLSDLMGVDTFDRAKRLDILEEVVRIIHSDVQHDPKFWPTDFFIGRHPG